MEVVGGGRERVGGKGGMWVTKEKEGGRFCHADICECGIINVNNVYLLDIKTNFPNILYIYATNDSSYCIEQSQ